MKTKEIEVQIMGKRFNFNIPENIRTEDFLEIIEYVESKYNRIKAEAADLDTFRLGLLVAINITEEFNSIRKENQKLQVVLNRIDNMISPAEEENRVTISYSGKSGSPSVAGRTDNP